MTTRRRGRSQKTWGFYRAIMLMIGLGSLFLAFNFYSGIPFRWDWRVGLLALGIMAIGAVLFADDKTIEILLGGF